MGYIQMQLSVNDDKFFRT